MGGITDSNTTDQFDNTVTVLEDGQSGSGLRAKVEQKPGGENALHVISENTNIVGGYAGVPVFDGGKYNVDWSRTDISLVNTGTGTQIFQYTGAGLLEAFMLHMEDKDTDVLLFIDGVERYDISCLVFEDMDFENDKTGAYPVSYDKTEKIFKHYNTYPFRFTTSFEIRCRANNKKVKEWVVNYLED